MTNIIRYFFYMSEHVRENLNFFWVTNWLKKVNEYVFLACGGIKWPNFTKHCFMFRWKNKNRGKGYYIQHSSTVDLYHGNCESSRPLGAKKNPGFSLLAKRKSIWEKETEVPRGILWAFYPFFAAAEEADEKWNSLEQNNISS